MSENNYFEGKVAVVTGAGGLLCSCISKALARKGAHVALIGRHAEKLEIVKSQIDSQGGYSRVYECNTCDEKAMEETGAAIMKEMGPCDMLVNGAGGNNSNAVTSIESFDERELSENVPDGMKGFFALDMNMFSDVIINNTMGTVIPTRVFARQMAGRETSVVNFGSMNSYCPLTKVPAYAIAKAGIVNWTQWASAYLAPAGIRINAVAPGFFVNERSKKLLGTVEEGLTPRGQAVINHTPQGKFGQAQDLVGCVLWLLDSSQSSFVTGITIPVDGGFLARSGV